MNPSERIDQLIAGIAAIDFLEGDKVNERALKNLVRAAIEYNQARKKKKAPARPLVKASKSKKA
jgi:hypothetical protein